MIGIYAKLLFLQIMDYPTTVDHRRTGYKTRIKGTLTCAQRNVTGKAWCPWVFTLDSVAGGDTIFITTAYFVDANRSSPNWTDREMDRHCLGYSPGEEPQRKEKVRFCWSLTDCPWCTWTLEWIMHCYYGARSQWFRLHVLRYIAALIFSVGVPLSRLIVDHAGRGRDGVYHCDWWRDSISSHAQLTVIYFGSI